MSRLTASKHPATAPTLLAGLLALLAPSCLVVVDEAEPAAGSDPSVESEPDAPSDDVAETSAELRSPRFIKAGAFAACAGTTGSNLLCWGKDRNGAPQTTPFASGINDAAQAAVWNSGGGVGVLTTGGSLRVHYIGSTNNLSIPNFSGVTQISSSPIPDGHTCLLYSTGRVSCTGKNGYGQLGNGTFTDSAPGAYTDVAGLTDAVEVKAGGYHTCARRMSGQLVCWGYAPAIGDGTEVSKATPQTISLMTNVRSLATGWYHTCVAQGASRNVYCWGWNPTGAVGDGTTNYRVSPRSVGITATQVTAGAGHSCAITGTASWAVKCWGSNGFGQMGTNSVGGQKTPFSVPAPSPTLAVSLIDAGGNFTCATATGSAGNTVCWGANESGQLGNGNTTGTTQRPSYVLGDALKLNGETCSSDGQCQSRNCIDGVCCNSRCGEGVLSDCQACSTAAGAAQNGVCGAELVPPLPLVGRQCGTSPNGLCALYCNGGLTCPPVNNPFLCGG